MHLLLHAPTGDRQLSRYYREAFRDAAELFVVTAFLTEWDDSLQLNPKCRSFRVIVGKDFGITRKAACEKVMAWLPPRRKAQFLVADQIGGFHPKAVFWKEQTGKCFAIIGSSNLTEAAFESNYEANIFSQLSTADYAISKKWVKSIEKLSVVVSEDWLRKYKESSRPQHHRGGLPKDNQNALPVLGLELPRPAGMEKKLASRRKTLTAYGKVKQKLVRLFRRCASKKINSDEFYESFQGYGSQIRLQGAGWEITGKHSDFRSLSEAFMRILDTASEDRDDVVSEEIENLKEKEVPTRGAFLSEMLCLWFPADYPVLNRPVRIYLKRSRYRPPTRSSEGSRYIHLAQTLRVSLLRNPDHPAKNLAELDTVIWLAYGKKK